MRVVVVGLGVQGRKRRAIAGDQVVATVDPIASTADFKSIEAVPPASFDAACVCVPDREKLPILRYLLAHQKHLLVEKPLLASAAEIQELIELSRRNRAACYTAYNHRFEPHIVRIKQILDSQKLGPIYLVRIFYGNGTARDVRNSPWRDEGLGVVSDIGSHLLDMVLFLFGPGSADIPVGQSLPLSHLNPGTGVRPSPGAASPETGGAVDKSPVPDPKRSPLDVPLSPLPSPFSLPSIWSLNRFENLAPDHVLFGFSGRPIIEMEATMVSWRNTFGLDVYGEAGSAHIQCLCKWGPSILTVRMRVLPSGRPEETVETLEQPDPTWKLEYDYFLQLCQGAGTNLENDLWIGDQLRKLGMEKEDGRKKTVESVKKMGSIR